MLALVGGTPGAIVALHLLRHKPRKQPFRSQLLLIAGLHLVLLLVPATASTRQLGP